MSEQTPAPAAAAPAPAAPAAATPAPATAAPAAAAPAAAPATSLVGDAKETPPAFDATAARAYLTERGGKADELAALDEAALKTKFDEAKAAESKPATPESIEVKVPEGFTVDEKQLTDFKATLADAKLSPSERAQKLVEMHAAALRGVQEQSTKAWQDLNKQWVTEVNADPEIGTANQALRDKVFATALSAYGKQYGEQAEVGLRQALGMTGAGNNPHIARFFYSAWKDRVESGPTSGKPADAQDAHKKALAALYPTANT